jgi:hypothetical protein
MGEEIKEFKCSNGDILKWDSDYTIRKDHGGKKVIAIHIEFPDEVNDVVKHIKSQANGKRDFERDAKKFLGVVEKAPADTTKNINYEALIQHAKNLKKQGILKEIVAQRMKDAKYDSDVVNTVVNTAFPNKDLF